MFLSFPINVNATKSKTSNQLSHWQKKDNESQIFLIMSPSALFFLQFHSIISQTTFERSPLPFFMSLCSDCGVIQLLALKEEGSPCLKPVADVSAAGHIKTCHETISHHTIVDWDGDNFIGAVGFRGILRLV